MIDATTVEEYMRDANPISDLEMLDADELAFAVAAVDTRRAIAMQAPAHHPTKTKTTGPAPPSRRRSVWAFAAAFVLILVVVGGAALVLRRDDTQVTNEPETPTTEAAPSTVVDEQAPPTTATATLAEPILVASLVWSRVPQDEAVSSPSDTQDMKSVTIGGPGFVAVGETGDAAVWTSADAISWSLVPNDQPPLGGPGQQSMQSVTVGGPGLVAVGFGGDEPGMAGRTAAVWTSVDGSAWSRVPYQDAFGSPGYGGNSTAMYSVTVGGPGLVAVGTDGRVAAVWTSTDGVTWVRAPHNPEAFGTGKVPDAGTEMEDVVAGGPGLVAVGSVDEGEEQSSAAVWTSRDGVTWARVPHDEKVFGGVGSQGISSVTLGGPGLVAVGAEEPNTDVAMGGLRAAVWTSPDGVTWSRVPDDEAIFGGGEGDETGMDDVVAVGSGLIAVGGRMAWTSPDGITWTRVPDAETIFGIGEMEDVIAGGTGLIAVGEFDDNATVWIAVPAE